MKAWPAPAAEAADTPGIRSASNALPVPIATPERIALLLGLDPDFAPVAARALPLAPRARPPGFASLLQIILEQQVSIQAGAAMWAKLLERLDGAVTAEAFLGLDEAALKASGFSRQKMVYGRGLAEAITSGRMDLEALAALPDEAALAALTALKGVGSWTAEIYLMFCQGRPDLMPAKDIALQAGAQWLKGLDQRPDHRALTAMAEAWRPVRSVAALMLWRHYRLTLNARREEEAR